MILAFDTETTGLPLWHEPSDHRDQPHLIQFAGVVLDDEGNEVDSLSTLVRPGPGAVMDEKAFEAHGITLVQALTGGCDPLEVLAWFGAQAARATQLVGHNVSFDIRLMRIHAVRFTGVKWEAPCPSFCTMKRSQAIVNLPPTERMKAAGRWGPKPPKLSECIKHFFGEELEGAHDALVDVRASVRVYQHLTRKLGVAA
jgi:DNA polymerase-3 subunit epsilon